MLIVENHKACKDVEAGHISLIPPTPLSLVCVLLHTISVCVCVSVSLCRWDRAVILSSNWPFFDFLYHSVLPCETTNLYHLTGYCSVVWIFCNFCNSILLAIWFCCCEQWTSLHSTVNITVILRGL